MNAARLQTLNMEAVALLVFILEEAKKDMLTSKSATEAAKAVLLLSGNVSVQITKERGKSTSKRFCESDRGPRNVSEGCPISGLTLILKKMKKHLERLK